ncbi:MAG TPA: acetylornithine transaminase [Bacilli bacterium]
MSDYPEGRKSAKSALFPTYARFPIALVKGEGSRLWDDQGKSYLDFMSGIAVTNLGHVPAAVKAALTEQLDKLWHVSNLFAIPNQERLAQLLTENSCADAVFFCNSGAEANEAAIKLARRYNRNILHKDRYEVITFRQSFHGRTLATLTATGQDKVKDGFAPLPEGFVHATFNDAAGLEARINDRTCAIMLEMVQGEGGIRPADPDFVKEVVRLCAKHDLLLIVDEIQTGMGRTGKLFAYQHYGIEPDIFTLAKGIGSGFPMGAMLGKEKLREAFAAGSHGSTFGGTPLATAAGIATIETMLAERLPERAERLGKLAQAFFAKELAGNPFVKQVRGLGLLIGIECAEPVANVLATLRERGLLAVSAGPNVLRLLPSLTIPEEDFQRGLSLVCGVLAEKGAAMAKP